MDAQLSNLVATLENLQISKYSVVSSFALTWFDYSLTFSEEVDLIWRRKWSFVTALYFATRCLPFFESVIIMLMLFQPNPMLSQCKASFYFLAWSYFVGIIIAGFILILRTYAICNGNKRTISFIIFIHAACILIGIYFNNNYVNTTIVIPSPFPPGIPFSGCLISQTGSTLWLDYLLLAFDESVILAVTILNISYQGGYGFSRLSRVILRDGILFYICLQVLTVINIIILHVAPVEAHLSACSILRILHAALTTRVLLNIRRTAYYHKNDTSAQLSRGAMPTPLVFEMQPIGAGESEGLLGPNESPGLATHSRSQEALLEPSSGALSEGTYQDSLIKEQWPDSPSGGLEMGKRDWDDRRIRS